jgi:cytochrome c oxidase subunit II
MAPVDVLQSALHPDGLQAAHISRLWWLMLAVTTAVFVVVCGFFAAALVRARRAAESSVAVISAESQARQHPTLTWAVAIAAGVTIATLFGLLVSSVWTGRAIASLGAASAVTINVTGHQFWWEIEYDDAVPARRVTTANEIHIPVGRPVVLKVTSRDVIHSFWAPNLHGKRDLVPGHTTAIWIQADRASVYHGQCAEFCGKQHAHMRFEIVAEPDDQFTRWLDAQRRPSIAPASDLEQRGQQLFLDRQCVLCHTIRGTAAAGRVGPELTHVATRGKIASATLPTTPDHLVRWIADPQGIKPGSQMPATPMSREDLDALAAYLEQLK